MGKEKVLKCIFNPFCSSHKIQQLHNYYLLYKLYIKCIQIFKCYVTLLVLILNVILVYYTEGFITPTYKVCFNSVHPRTVNRKRWSYDTLITLLFIYLHIYC